MLKRSITAFFIIVAMVGSFLLRQFADERLFNVLIYAFSLIGTFEMVRAIKDKLTPFLRIFLLIYAAALTPLHTFWGLEASLAATFAAVIVILCSLVVQFESATLDGAAYAVFTVFYPSVMLLPMLMLNDMGANGFVPLLLVFVIAPLSDTFAYIVGSVFKGVKLCEHISPKKTVSGFIGGLIGGTAGAVAIRLIFPLSIGVFAAGEAEFFIYALIGFVGSAVSAFGDLVEGAVKRKLKVKDLGNLLPGHGGILDRIDSTMFVGAFIYLIFGILLV